MTFKPTPEQEAVLDAAQSSQASLMIAAMAGCAKTTTLELLSKKLPLRPSLALAFNVKIKKELEKRFPKHFEIKTMNGLGHIAWSRAINKRCEVNPKKLYDIIKEVMKKNNSPYELWSPISQTVGVARQWGLVPSKYADQFPGFMEDTYENWEMAADSRYNDMSEELAFLCRTVLTEAIKQSFLGTIDYDDQIYMSTCFRGVFPKFGEVMVDEAQDLSILNHHQVKMVSAGRLTVCGDPRQAIYAFRGADSSSMEKIRGLKQEWKDLPLTLTFRCPSNIVARQQHHAPGYMAASTNVQGAVHDWQGRETWSIADVESACGNQRIAILCRNNAPIIAAALRIIRGGRGCTVLGSEIGKSLVALSKKILSSDDLDTETCFAKILEWEKKEVSLALANEKDERVAIIRDKAECLRAVLESGPAANAGELRSKLTTMFQKENLNITLATGHKAKGLEWPVIVHLDPWRIPSQFARKAAAEGNNVPMEQDLNLRYVIETRSQDTLILANLEQMVP